MNDRFKFRIAVYERQQNNMPWAFVEYIDPDNQHWGLNQCGDIISDSNYSAHYTRKNAPDSVHRVYEPEMCTGFSDKNGKLIHDGDVVIKRDINALGYGRIRKCFVHYNNEWAAWAITTQYNDTYPLSGFEPEAYEIIGNIHEQAEQKD